MFKTFRVAGLAAAAAFLCASPAAAAEDAKVAPALASAAVSTPVARLETPTVNAAPTFLRTNPDAIVERSAADTPFTPGRTRPDRTGEAPFAAPAVANSGVVGQARVQRSLADLVSEHLDAAVTDEQFECLASAVYYESRGEPLEGQLAVAEVILNRVRSGRFRESVCAVVTQPSQFSFVRGGAIPQAPRDSAAWRRSVAIAHIATNRLAAATGQESLFFHATYVSPRWGRPRIARIGNHIFYR